MPELPLDDPGFWTALSDRYSMASDFTVAFALRALREANLPGGARVLDIATGNGALAVAAAHAGFDTLATDFSEGLIRTLGARAVPGLEVRTMNGEALELPDAAFDAAFSMFGIMLFADWRAGLREMARVVRPGGTASLGTWLHPAGAASNLLLGDLCERLFPSMDRSSGIEGMRELRDPSRLRAELEGVGLEDVHIAEDTHDYPVEAVALDDPDALFTFSPLWPRLDAERRATVMAAIREALPANGPLLVPSTALIATARRGR